MDKIKKHKTKKHKNEKYETNEYWHLKILQKVANDII